MTSMPANLRLLVVVVQCLSLAWADGAAFTGIQLSVQRQTVQGLQAKLIELLQESMHVTILGCGHQVYLEDAFSSLRTAVTCVDDRCQHLSDLSHHYGASRPSWTWQCTTQHGGGPKPSHQPSHQPPEHEHSAHDAVVLTTIRGQGIPITQVAGMIAAIPHARRVLTLELEPFSATIVQVSIHDRRTQEWLLLTQQHNSFQEAFERVYTNQVWGSEGGGSGHGSSLNYTAVLRAALPKLLKEYGIKSLLDSSCGGMVWMPLVLEEMEDVVPGFRFMGADAACAVVDAHKERFTDHSNWEFTCSDASNMPLPTGYDLVVSRDAFQHLPLRATFLFLNNVKASGARYLLIGSYIKSGANRNIAAGEYFDLDITRPPFNVRPAPVRVIDENTIDNKHMLLFEVESMEWDDDINV